MFSSCSSLHFKRRYVDLVIYCFHNGIGNSKLGNGLTPWSRFYFARYDINGFHCAGEQRVRVHTMCVPIADNVAEVIKSADQQCIIGLLAKMGMSEMFFFEKEFTIYN